MVGLRWNWMEKGVGVVYWGRFGGLIGKGRVELGMGWMDVRVLHEPHHEKMCLREFTTKLDTNQPAQLETS